MIPITKARREERRKIADGKAAEWRTLTPQQQIVALDLRLGIGVGARKQRARLARKKAA